MAASQWPRGRWLAAYSNWYGVCRTLTEAKRCVDIKLRQLQIQPGPVRLAIAINAVIVRVGSETAYHGRIYGTKAKKMYWRRVAPLGPPRVIVGGFTVKDRGRKR